MRLVIQRSVDAAGLARLRAPRDDVVVEEPAGADRFTLASGPFSRYERTLDVNGTRVTETIEARLAAPFWAFLFALPMRRALRRPSPPGRRPWWAPPAVLDARSSTVLALLCTAALIAGYLNTLVTQTITYAASEFGTDRTGQGIALAIVRGGVVVTLVAAALADRYGRRRLLVVVAVAGCLVAATGALAPDLSWLTASQVLARGFGGALALLIIVVAAEEMPAGSRAYGLSLLTMATGLGVGICLWALPLADTGEQGWRLVYLVPLLGVAVAVAVGRRLPESRRFVAPHGEAALAGHGRRFWLLATTGFLIAVFAAPASQLQNEFLRDERGFSAARISLFTVLTSTPAVIGIVVGGRVADVRGRRLVGAVGLAGGAMFTAVQFATAGWPMWMWSLVGGIVAGLAVPAIQVYRPELFPTGVRGRAHGTIEMVSLTGSAIGLVTAGWLVDRWDSFAGPMALLCIGPLLVAGLVLVAYPETARLELEELNPEDRAAIPQPPH